MSAQGEQEALEKGGRMRVCRTHGQCQNAEEKKDRVERATVLSQRR